MDFNIVVGNPPYKAGMHLKFLEACLRQLKDGGEFIFVHPAEWLVQKRESAKNIKIYKPLRDALSAYHSDITLIDNPWKGRGVELYVPLTITHISAGAGVDFTDDRTASYGGVPIIQKPKVKLNSLHEVTQWGSSTDVASFLQKIRNHTERWNVFERVKRGNWYINLSSITGNGKTTHTYYDGKVRSVFNMYSLVNSTSLEVSDAPQNARPQGGKTEGNEKIWFSFPTKEEAQHALDFITRTKFFRVYLALIKIDQHAADVLLGDIPWLDWAIEWTDEMLAEKFNFSIEEWDMMDEVMNHISE